MAQQPPKKSMTHDNLEMGAIYETYLGSETDDIEKARKLATRRMYETKKLPLTVYSASPITTSKAYKEIVNKHRVYFVIWFFIFITLSPLVFRFAVGMHSDTIDKWGEKLTWLENIILLVVFFDMLGNIFRGLPMLSGRPTELESSRYCVCNGSVVLGTSSPFVSEDEAVFLRSLIGRTCTLFHTCGGRHSFRGLYVDSILNEKRGKGEEVRKRLWHAWMRFLTQMVRVAKKAKDRSTPLAVDPVAPEEELRPSQYKTYKFRTESVAGQQDRLSEVDYDVNDTSNIRVSVGNMVSTNVHLRDSKPSFKTYTVVYGSSTTYTSSESFDLEKMSLAHRTSTRTPSQLNRFSMIDNGKKGSHLASISEAGSSEVDDFNPNEELTIDMGDILPLICFMEGWLKILKNREWTYDYTKPKEALNCIFTAAPFTDYFEEADLVPVFRHLNNLFNVFMNPNPVDVPATPAATPLQPDFQPATTTEAPCHFDDLSEINWILKRDGLPDWNVTWSYFSRARVRAVPHEKLIKEGPKTIFESTRIVPGSIVYRLPDRDGPAADYTEEWLTARAAPMKVLRFEDTKDGRFVYVTKFVVDSIDTAVVPPCYRLDQIALLEQNRGKAGALNVYADYLRCKAIQWCANKPPAQIFHGIIDARHMLAEPDIFWNDAIPFFSVSAETKKPTRRFGRASGDVPQCLLVQYPQFFSNVTRDDFLDNKNSAYYTVWQTLRDCAKTITSSGTNAIWDITDPTFSYATTSRIEDTGTTQKYLHSAITVHLPCFVAFGIAKQTEDYIEAVYRWSTGAVELFWSTLPTSSFMHFIVIAIFTFFLGLACFASAGFWYYLWLFILFIGLLLTFSEKSQGKKPLRRFIVSSVIVMNTMYWISNCLSIFWMIVIPIRIAFYKDLPLASTPGRALFWMFAALIIRYPTAVMTDHVIAMTRFLSVRTHDWNYNMTLWRSSQLYACSFAYTVLSILTGTINAVRACFFNRDLTMWASFRVSNQVFDKAWRDVISCQSKCSWEFAAAVRTYAALSLRQFYAAFTMPDILTKYYSAALLMLQLVCIIVSLNVTNSGDTSAIIITLIVCGLNLYLVFDIALLLMPSFSHVVGNPARPEYIFAFLGVIVIVSTVAGGDISVMKILKELYLQP